MSSKLFEGKDFNVQLDIKKQVTVSNISVVSEDKDANKFIVTLVDDSEVIDITGYTAKAAFKNHQDGRFEQDCTIVDAINGIIGITLNTDVIAVPGLVNASISLYKGEMKATSARFHFTVDGSLLDGTQIVPTNQLPNYKDDLAAVQSNIDSVQTQLNQTVLGGSVDPETAQARVGAHGELFDTLRDRLNDEQLKREALESKVEDSETLQLNPTDSNASIINYPPNTKGLFRPGAKGVPHIRQDVVNGDFSNGIDGWGKTYSTLSTSNNILTITGDGVGKTPEAQNVTSVVAPKSGEVVFIYAKVKVTNSDVNAVGVHLKGSTSGAIYSITTKNPTINDSTELYVKYSISSNVLEGNLKVCPWHIYADASIANGKVMEVDGNVGVFAINMTSCGIEDYTEEQMLNIVRNGYWEGTKTTALSYDLESVGENKFNKDDIIRKDGFYRSDSGTLTADPTAGYTENYIKAYPNKNYKYIGTGFVNIYYLDINKQWIGRAVSIGWVSPSNCAYIQLQYSPSIVNFDDWVITINGIQPTKYIPYTSDKTEFSVGEDTPLVQLPNGKMNKVNHETGDLDVEVKRYVLQGEDITSIDNTTFINVELVKTKIPLFIDGGGFTNGKDENVNIAGYSEIVFTDRDNISSVGTFYSFDTGQIVFVVAKDTYADLVTAQNDLTGKEIYYELAQPFSIEDGKKGYKAPSHLPARENGDLVVIPKYKKKYLINSSTTITLDEEINEIDYVRTEIDGEVVDLGCTLEADGKTITLDQPLNGWADTKGTIPDKNCLYPIVKGDIPVNMKAVIESLLLAVSILQAKLREYEEKQLLINLEFDYRLTVLENV